MKALSTRVRGDSPGADKALDSHEATLGVGLALPFVWMMLPPPLHPFTPRRLHPASAIQTATPLQTRPHPSTPMADNPNAGIARAAAGFGAPLDRALHSVCASGIGASWVPSSCHLRDSVFASLIPFISSPLPPAPPTWTRPLEKMLTQGSSGRPALGLAGLQPLSHLPLPPLPSAPAPLDAAIPGQPHLSPIPAAHWLLP